MLRLPSPRRAAVVGVLGMALLAACGGNDAGTSGSQSPAAPSTTASSMTASGPFGAACSTVPASGPGSLEDLVNTLNSAQAITVFAPTNDAFAALPKPTLDKALGDPSGLLTTVLTYHVVQGQLTPDQLPGSHKTLQGSTLQITGSDQNFTINRNSSVVCGNIKTTNATIYLIDQVLLPKN